MTRVTWDGPNRDYDQGISKGVLYPQNSPGVAWNGLISITESNTDNSVPAYFDGQRFLTQSVPSAFSGTIVAFTYPDEFEPYIGNVSGVTGQSKDSFGFSYRTNRELHIVYNALAAPSSDQYGSSGDTPNPVNFSWSFTTTPIAVTSAKASSHFVVLLDDITPGALSALEDVLYGNDTNGPSLPDMATIVAIFEANATLVVVDNGDGTATITGPSTAITTIDSTTVQINWSSVVFIDTNNFTIYSL
jgi:hypothetical protein